MAFHEKNSHSYEVTKNEKEQVSIILFFHVNS